VTATAGRFRVLVTAVFLLLLMVALGLCQWLPGRAGVWQLPPGYPEPRIPADNPLNTAKIELGRLLFYDTRLSINNSMSCGSCHIQALAFTDARGQAVGATGQMHPRGAMSLVNVAYVSRLTWANNLLDSLEEQALTPLFGEVPVEMGMAGREASIASMLRSDARYRELFPRAFPGNADPYSVLGVVRAIGAFVRTIVSFDSPYDRFVSGDSTALSAAAQRGLELFNSERLECFHCHGGFNFTDSSSHANAVVESVGFHNTGLYNIDSEGAYPAGNTGLYEMSGEPRDMGRFRAPTLRNIALTAPYMHDGSVASLRDVIAHYGRGGRAIDAGPHAGDGSRSPFKSSFVRGFELSPSEELDLLAFLDALTDESVLDDPRFSDPYQNK
jgi:cytochrome c peroxidase